MLGMILRYFHGYAGNPALSFKSNHHPPLFHVRPVALWTTSYSRIILCWSRTQRASLARRHCYATNDLFALTSVFNLFCICPPVPPRMRNALARPAVSLPRPVFASLLPQRSAPPPAICAAVPRVLRWAVTRAQIWPRWPRAVVTRPSWASCTRRDPTTAARLVPLAPVIPPHRFNVRSRGMFVSRCHTCLFSRRESLRLTASFSMFVFGDGQRRQAEVWSLLLDGAGWGDLLARKPHSGGGSNDLSPI